MLLPPRMMTSFARPDDVEVAVVVEVAEVAGVQPLARPRRGGGLGVLVVLAVVLADLDQHLADLAGRQRLAVVVDDADLGAPSGCRPTRPRRSSSSGGMYVKAVPASVIE